MRRLPFRVAGTLIAAALALSACSSGVGGDQNADEGTIRVVASTNVYGNILESVGGDYVSVESIINRPSQDPHSYEATARDKLAVSGAGLVVLNGGGYDSFMEVLVEDEGVPSEDVLNAVEISGLEDGSDHTHGSEDAESGSGSADAHDGHSHGGFNEHVWYDPSAMALLAEAAAQRLAELDPANEAAFRDNAAAFSDGIAELETRLDALRASGGDRDVAMTEPVPDYLLEDAGLHNVTPADFTEAVEEGSDLPPAVLKQMQDLVASGDIAFLAYNDQTSTSQTEAVRSAAEDAGVPVLNFSETLPEGQDYLGWMNSNVDALEGVLK
ncbi:metal ABC transporter solute-binding protein, Zn/Mn family [Arthrobacter caoxuetaonis]|uniref:metal ABC transporter solute-binding protein, Zn/Mn family n=1 Tax=Arthrobacter caoxuetaonis TaxID=2886935 RepID=UPI001D136E53|nr:zinc ABC transporter substrate-binding protein [Arthrobacter caoxuetaonis]MCC3280912.1 zinc ABC transporter substrate-binding protein [Arthrobacter caoxuetaonis]